MESTGKGINKGVHKFNFLFFNCSKKLHKIKIEAVVLYIYYK